jgi:hypothetical protein
MPYADLLAICNALAEKPVTRFDTRANSVRRTEAILELRDLTLAEAAGLMGVVLPERIDVLEAVHSADTTTWVALPGDDADPKQPEADAGHEGDPMGDKRVR